MPLTEKDIIRIRQFIQQMGSGLIEGMQVFATYHDSNLAALPSNPTGDGTTGGWHREPTEASNWMSVKTALKDTAGTWGTPIRVFGLQGTDSAGAGLSADIPKLEQITFIGDGSSKVGWTAGTVRYDGNSYAIAVKAVGDGSTDAYIYWDDADGQTSFKTTATFATAIAANHWVVCFNDSGKAIPATSYRILHAGLIQAATLSAITAALGSITSGSITLSLGGDTRLRIDSSGLYVSNNAGGDWTEVIKNDAGTVTLFADILKASEITTNKINNLAVETAKIGDEATVIIASASTAGLSGYIQDESGDPTQIQTLTETSIGGTVHIVSTCILVNTAVGNRDARMNIERDGSEIYTTEMEEIPGGDGERYFNISMIDVPGAGSTQYELNAQQDGFVGNPNEIKAKERNLAYSESKGK